MHEDGSHKNNQCKEASQDHQGHNDIKSYGNSKAIQVGLQKRLLQEVRIGQYLRKIGRVQVIIFKYYSDDEGFCLRDLILVCVCARACVLQGW